jgi:hypothetical protein
MTSDVIAPLSFNLMLRDEMVDELVSAWKAGVWEIWDTFWAQVLGAEKALTEVSLQMAVELTFFQVTLPTPLAGALQPNLGGSECVVSRSGKSCRSNIVAMD